MPITAASIYRIILKFKKLPDNSSVGQSVRWFRNMNLQRPRSFLLRHCKVNHTTMHGCEVFTLTPPNVDNSGVYLFIHGGGFVGGPHFLHWMMADKIANAKKYPLIAVNYPLAPEHQYPVALEKLQQIYLDLLATHPNISFIGDSAGANLALALTMKLRDEALPMPDSVILISPCLDMRLNNPDIDALEKSDVMLSQKALQTLRLAYAGNADLTHPYLSPLFGDIAQLPPILLLCGTSEIFYPDALLFVQKVTAANGNIQFHQGPEMFHDWTLFPFLPEAEKAIQVIANF